MKDYETGYFDAISDVEEAMRRAVVNTIGPAGYMSYNEPKIYIDELRKLTKLRFPK